MDYRHEPRSARIPIALDRAARACRLLGPGRRDSQGLSAYVNAAHGALGLVGLNIPDDKQERF
jgi:hypothetical protein